jgi:hypothetical protein
MSASSSSPCTASNKHHECGSIVYARTSFNSASVPPGLMPH